MDIVSQLLLLGFFFTVGYAVLAAQTIALNRVFKRLTGRYSPAWSLLMIAFIITGSLRVWSMIRLPIAITRAKVQGVLPESLTFEQWITILGALIVMVLFILAFDRHRRDLRSLGAMD